MAPVGELLCTCAAGVYNKVCTCARLYSKVCTSAAVCVCKLCSVDDAKYDHKCIRLCPYSPLVHRKFCYWNGLYVHHSVCLSTKESPEGGSERSACVGAVDVYESL